MVLAPRLWTRNIKVAISRVLLHRIGCGFLCSRENILAHNQQKTPSNFVKWKWVKFEPKVNFSENSRLGVSHSPIYSWYNHKIKFKIIKARLENLQGAQLFERIPGF